MDGVADQTFGIEGLRLIQKIIVIASSSSFDHLNGHSPSDTFFFGQKSADIFL